MSNDCAVDSSERQIYNESVLPKGLKKTLIFQTPQENLDELSVNVVVPAPREGLLEQLRNQLKAILERVAKRPESEQIALLLEFKDIAECRLQQLESPVPPLPEPDLSGKSYPLYQKKTDALEHLGKHWGQWLKYFTPSLDRDYLFQDQLGKRDPVLMKAVWMQKRKIERREKTTVSEIIPPKKARIDANLNALSQEKHRDAYRIVGALARRRTLG